ncbi:hypothetical protein PENSPDRAFT_754069 [Peniophora sp. CONT]|nr:hypothetical protein PENSPDRAFT_754069 [Peniophora sp. CONT]
MKPTRPLERRQQELATVVSADRFAGLRVDVGTGVLLGLACQVVGWMELLIRHMMHEPKRICHRVWFWK